MVDPRYWCPICHYEFLYEWGDPGKDFAAINSDAFIVCTQCDRSSKLKEWSRYYFQRRLGGRRQTW